MGTRKKCCCWRPQIKSKRHKTQLTKYPRVMLKRERKAGELVSWSRNARMSGGSRTNLTVLKPRQDNAGLPSGFWVELLRTFRFHVQDGFMTLNAEHRVSQKAPHTLNSKQIHKKYFNQNSFRVGKGENKKQVRLT